MKLNKFLLLGTIIFILSGCGGEAEESSENSEDGMGTLSSESGEINEEEGNNGAVDNNESENNVDNDESNNDSGLLDLSNTETGWINFEGEMGGNIEYQATQPIEYDSNKDYELNSGAYIAYFNGEEFIQTVNQSPGVIESVESADNIRLSFHESFSNSISLTEQ